jgi:6-pyruvoyltetrahydropterin/6-carboxytetrahydropterin synthase
MFPRTVHLTRELRFFLPSGHFPGDASPVLNSWAGWPTSAAIGPFLTLRATLRGPIDPHTDYLCNVKRVDELLRDHAIKPACRQSSRSVNPLLPGQLLAEFWEQLADKIPAGIELDELQLGISPFVSFSINQAYFPMIVVSQQFEFSASHRLHNHTLSDEDNRALYGKCNNPHGHGHNYVLEISLELYPESARDYAMTKTERIVKTKIIDRLDHRHLNLEISPFDQVNPTVENIAVAIWDWLAPEFLAPNRLHRVRVYETPKTWADYSGPPSSATPRTR